MDEAPPHADEAAVYDRCLRSPMTAKALRSLKEALADNRVPRRTVARRPLS